MINWCGECGGVCRVIKYFIFTDQIYQHLLINTQRWLSQSWHIMQGHQDLPESVPVLPLLCTSCKVVLELVEMVGVMVSARCEVVNNVTM